MTVHRGQGSQFAGSPWCCRRPESPLLTRELLYTAVTRAREHVRVVGSEAAVRAAVDRPVQPGERPAAPAGRLSPPYGAVPALPSGGTVRRITHPMGRSWSTRPAHRLASTYGVPQTRWRCDGVAVTHDEVGHAGAAGWADSFRRSDLGAAVFEVSRGIMPRVLEWAERQPIPRATRRSVHTPAVDAWAVLDGGIVSLDGYGPTTFPCGVRVIGLQAFRLVLADLGPGAGRRTEARRCSAGGAAQPAHATPADHPSASNRPTCWRAAPTRC